MNIVAAFYRSSVGKKIIVAVSGIILILFVIGHLLGNLQIFIGPDWINGYSEHLRDLGPLLWLIRIFLLATVITHIYVTIQLAIENRRARPQAYIDKHYVKATFASRHMRSCLAANIQLVTTQLDHELILTEVVVKLLGD